MIPKFGIDQLVYYCETPCNINRGDYDYNIYEAQIVSIHIITKDCSEGNVGIEYTILYRIADVKDDDEWFVGKEREIVPEFRLFKTQDEAAEFVQTHFKQWKKDCEEATEEVKIS